MSLPSTSLTAFAEKLKQLHGQLSQVILGKSDVITEILTALLTGGSVLIEDVPGVGKTTLAKALAQSVDLKFNRIQSTPDLLPGDVFGFSVLNPQTGQFSFRKGPVFCNILLVDEINRASPRTQAALLEAMAERQVTIEGTQYDLDPPFLVLATQNPLEHQGTFPLPESQLDRFLFMISMDYPDRESEIDLLYSQGTLAAPMELAPVLSHEELIECHRLVKHVFVERSIAHYLVRLVEATRNHPQITLGASPRCSLMLFQACQARAFLLGREMVLPDDVQHLAPLVLRHRLVTSRQSSFSDDSRATLLQEILSQTEVPT
jgi:MoxR-like ATPase